MAGCIPTSQSCRSCGSSTWTTQTSRVRWTSWRRTRSWRISICATPVLDGRIEDLSKAEDLQILDLTGTEVTGDLAALANFTELLQLRLSNTAVSGELKSLAKLKRLTELDLSNTAVFGDASSDGRMVKDRTHRTCQGYRWRLHLFQQFEPFKPMELCRWSGNANGRNCAFLDVSRTPQFSLAQRPSEALRWGAESWPRSKLQGAASQGPFGRRSLIRSLNP